MNLNTNLDLLKDSNEFALKFLSIFYFWSFHHFDVILTELSTFCEPTIQEDEQFTINSYKERHQSESLDSTLLTKVKWYWFKNQYCQITRVFLDNYIFKILVHSFHEVLYLSRYEIVFECRISWTVFDWWFIFSDRVQVEFFFI